MITWDKDYDMQFTRSLISSRNETKHVRTPFPDEIGASRVAGSVLPVDLLATFVALLGLE